MSITQQRTDLIKLILEDETIAAEEDEILHMLLIEQVSKNPVAENKENVTFGQKAADNLARFAGSWVFIIIFFTILAFWIILNTVF